MCTGGFFKDTNYTDAMNSQEYKKATLLLYKFSGQLDVKIQNAID